jgi:nucleoid-associated protein YgaU
MGKNMSNKQGQPTCQHTIEAGDTFSDIALAYYGNGSEAQWQKIATANSGVSAENLQIGQQLTIPA